MFDEYATTICFPRGGGGAAALSAGVAAFSAGRGPPAAAARSMACRDRHTERDAGEGHSPERRAKSMSNL